MSTLTTNSDDGPYTTATALGAAVYVFFLKHQVACCKQSLCICTHSNAMGLDNRERLHVAVDAGFGQKKVSTQAT